MQRIIVSALVIAVLTSCGHHQHYTDIGDDYYVDYVCKHPKVEVYRSLSTDKKLRGKITLKTSGIHDRAVNAGFVGNFKRGVLNGKDSVFANGILREVTTHRKGVLHGEQIAFDDSAKVVSTFIDGTIHGYQETFVNDWLFKKTYYNRGVRDSTEYYYDGFGNLVTTLQYHHIQSTDWLSQFDFENYEFISYTSLESLSPTVLRRAEYRGTVVFFSHDPTGVVQVSPRDVVHRSIAWEGYCEQGYSDTGYFYVIDENTCKVCDYIDHKGIWIAYVGPGGSHGIEGLERIAFYNLNKKHN